MYHPCEDGNTSLLSLGEAVDERVCSVPGWMITIPCLDIITDIMGSPSNDSDQLPTILSGTTFRPTIIRNLELNKRIIIWRFLFMAVSVNINPLNLEKTSSMYLADVVGPQRCQSIRCKTQGIN